MFTKVSHYKIELEVTEEELKALRDWCQNPWGLVELQDEGKIERSARSKLWKAITE